MDQRRLADYGALIDLAGFVEELEQIITARSSRPSAQKALALRLLGSQNIKNLCDVVVFKKKEHDTRLSATDCFPRDFLQSWVNGKVVEYFLDLKKRAARAPSDESLDQYLAYVEKWLTLREL